MANEHGEECSPGSGEGGSVSQGGVKQAGGPLLYPQNLKLNY